MFKKIFKAIFVISGVLASVWKVFIKFHWHGQKLTWGRYWSIWSNAGKPDSIIFGLTLLGWPNFFDELGCIGTSVCIWVLYNEGLLDTNRNAYSEEAWREKRIVNYRHSLNSVVSISAIFNLMQLIILSYFPPP